MNRADQIKFNALSYSVTSCERSIGRINANAAEYEAKLNTLEVTVASLNRFQRAEEKKQLEAIEAKNKKELADRQQADVDGGFVGGAMLVIAIELAITIVGFVIYKAFHS